MHALPSRRAARRIVGLFALVLVLAGCTTYTYSVNATPDPSDSTYFSVENNAKLTLTTNDLLKNDAVKVIETKNGSSETSYYTPTFMRLKGGVDHQVDFGPFTIASAEGGQVSQVGWGGSLTYTPPSGKYVGGDSFQYDACRTLPSVSNGKILTGQDYVLECGTATVHIAVESPRSTTTMAPPSLPIDWCLYNSCYGNGSTSTTSTTAAPTTTTTAAPTTTTTAALFTSFSTTYDNALFGGGVALTPAPSTLGQYAHGTIAYSIQDNLGGGHTLKFNNGTTDVDTIVTVSGANSGSVTLPAGTYSIKDGATVLDSSFTVI